MKVFEALGRLPRHCCDLTLRHQIGGDDVRERATLHVLHDNPKFILVQERVNVIHYVRMARCAHDEDLVDDEVLLRLLLKVHLFDGDG